MKRSERKLKTLTRYSAEIERTLCKSLTLGGMKRIDCKGDESIDFIMLWNGSLIKVSVSVEDLAAPEKREEVLEDALEELLEEFETMVQNEYGGHLPSGGILERVIAKTRKVLGDCDV